MNIVPNIPLVLECQLLPGHFADDSLVVVVSQSPGQFLVVHGGVVGTLPPQLCNLVRFVDLKLKVVVCPLDQVRVGGYQQELQEELPQL